MKNVFLLGDMTMCHENLENIKHEIHLKSCQLYYLNNKDKLNKNRKKYKRQAWKDRADNPKNKKQL